MTLADRRAEAEAALQKAREEASLATQRVIFYSGQVELLTKMMGDAVEKTPLSTDNGSTVLGD